MFMGSSRSPPPSLLRSKTVFHKCLAYGEEVYPISGVAYELNWTIGKLHRALQWHNKPIFHLRVFGTFYRGKIPCVYVSDMHEILQQYVFLTWFEKENHECSTNTNTQAKSTSLSTTLRTALAEALKHLSTQLNVWASRLSSSDQEDRTSTMR